MEQFLKEIEGSENNNPQLTAALREIARLQSIIEDAKSILEMATWNTTWQIESGELYRPTFDQLNDSKIDLLSNLLCNE